MVEGEREAVMFVLPWVIPVQQPPPLLVIKLFISFIGLVILCVGARLFLVARKQERSR